MPLLKMFGQLSFHLMLLYLNNTSVNSIDFENLPDDEKFNLIQSAVQKLPVNEKAKLVKYLLGDSSLQVITKPSQHNATNVLTHNLEQEISLMNKAQMGNVLEAIAQRLKNS